MADLTTMDLLVAQLRNTFPAGPGGKFVMEYPGRVLDPDTYAFPVDGVYSEITKPQPVVEEEFRLTDGCFDVAADVSAGSNGSRVSTGYTGLINTLIPQIDDQDAQFMKDRQAVRKWLLEWVPGPDTGEDDDAPAWMTRLQVYQMLLARYEQAQTDWRKRKTTMLENAMALTGADRDRSLEEYSRWLAEDGAAEEAQVESFFSEAVVKGYYHEVRACLGFLDIKSPSELLEEAKAVLRNAGLLALDESETILPVQLQPEDWFTSLATDMSPVDLLLDPESIMAQIVAKQNSLQQLEEQYSMLSSIPTGDPVALKQKVQSAQTALDQANAALVDSFEAAVGTVAKMYIQAQDAPIDDAMKGDLGNLVKSETGFPITPDQVDQLVKLASDVNAKQTALTAASRDLTAALAAEAQAQVTTMSTQLSDLQAQMQGLRNEISNLQAMVSTTASQQVLQTTLTAGDATKQKPPSFDASKTPAFSALNAATTPPAALLPSGTPVSGNWIDVILHTDSTVLATAKTDNVTAASSSFDLDLLFGSASGSWQSSSSDHADQALASTTAIDIGMRCTKVEIDRGWLDEDVFEALHSFCALHSTGDVAAALPSVPTGFLVAKDVTIKIDISTMTDANKAHFDSNSSSVSGGFLCFSYGSSSSAQNSSSSSQMTNNGSTAVIRIPQPQILGWFLSVTPAQTLPTYQALPPDFLLSGDSPPPVSAPAALGNGHGALDAVARRPAVEAPAAPAPGQDDEAVNGVHATAGARG